ncbi:hypothetical protein NAV33_12880 [Pseudomonas stutzeri]|uniref:hypothetical protein n=1 Tax=Stutzerimonas stutzeri TaxID=316 RepID=UPI00210CDBFF|nr:hypothetical protein [Stutzerimonas stutzeri]MCQ4312787.1 hypothetical protein [Stutzerimonas stutzeri]
MEQAGTQLPDIRAIFSSTLLNLESTLKRDKAQARTAFAVIFPRIDIELRGEEVWTQIATGPTLQVAVGADVYNRSCGKPHEPLSVRLK